MKTIRTLSHRLAYRATVATSAHPALYYGLQKISGRHDDRCVSKKTDIVIEGFPRSSNSTTVRSFLLRQKRKVAVARHKHNAAQLLRASQLGIPAIVLIRAPKRATISMMALAEEVKQRQNRTNMDYSLTMSDCLRSWLHFYSTALPHLSSLVVAPFEQVTRDIAPFIEKVNEKWGTKFDSRETSDSALSEEDMTDMLKLAFHALPTNQRDTIKDDLSDQFDAACEKDQVFRKQCEHAQELHDRIVACA